MSGQEEPRSYAGRRNPRFVTRRRGGTLEDDTHHALALWAAACAEHVLDLFEATRADDRPRTAIQAAQRWACGEVTMISTRTAAYGAHAAARESTGAARAAARAAGHAAATAHMADHVLGSAYYALQAVASAAPGDANAVARERQWQIDQLAPSIKQLVLDDMRLRPDKFRGAFGRPDQGR